MLDERRGYPTAGQADEEVVAQAPHDVVPAGIETEEGPGSQVGCWSASSRRTSSSSTGTSASGHTMPRSLRTGRSPGLRPQWRDGYRPGRGSGRPPRWGCGVAGRGGARRGRRLRAAGPGSGPGHPPGQGHRRVPGRGVGGPDRRWERPRCGRGRGTGHGGGRQLQRRPRFGRDDRRQSRDGWLGDGRHGPGRGGDPPDRVLGAGGGGRSGVGRPGRRGDGAWRSHQRGSCWPAPAPTALRPVG